MDTNQPIPSGYVQCCSCFKHPNQKDCMFCKDARMIKLAPNKVLCPACNGKFEKNQFCTHCVGWGYVAKDSPDATCLHKWTHVAMIGRCFNRYKCSLCGHIKEVDSSD